MLPCRCRSNLNDLIRYVHLHLLKTFNGCGVVILLPMILIPLYGQGIFLLQKLTSYRMEITLVGYRLIFLYHSYSMRQRKLHDWMIVGRVNHLVWVEGGTT